MGGRSRGVVRPTQRAAGTGAINLSITSSQVRWPQRQGLDVSAAGGCTSPSPRRRFTCRPPNAAEEARKSSAASIAPNTVSPLLLPPLPPPALPAHRCHSLRRPAGAGPAPCNPTAAMAPFPLCCVVSNGAQWVNWSRIGCGSLCKPATPNGCLSPAAAACLGTLGTAPPWCTLTPLKRPLSTPPYPFTLATGRPGLF